MNWISIRVASIVLIFLIPTCIKAQTYVKETVSFKSGKITLVGDLYIPKIISNPYPVVVFTHGSGDSGRDNGRYQEEAEHFAKSGIGSFIYDKRGYGMSEGDWKKATFENLADDALAAISVLQIRDDIDHERVGLRGASQSGWIIPIAASKSKDIKFIILISPLGVTPYEQILFDVRTDVSPCFFSKR